MRKRRAIWYRVLEVQEGGRVTLGVYVLETQRLQSPLTGRPLGESHRLVQIETQIWDPESGPLVLVAFEDQLKKRWGNGGDDCRKD